ncbi:MAG: PEP-CTERM sorting domain-containing protein [Gammaproteobacteria bacterium]|nr:MAG: PEP-CTERM sorting domain-containing protein [Gammaproteobacteria bacterium]
MKKLTSVVGILAVFLLVEQSFAASYNFDILYNGGGSTSLETGSDDPIGTNLQPGDTYTWNLHTNASSFWRVDTGDSFFPLGAFGVNESAIRTGDFDLVLRNNGTNVFFTSEVAATMQWVHVGTNAISLATGLEFDEMQLSFALTSAVVDYSFDPLLPENALNGNPSDTTINGRMSIFGAPEAYSGISLVSVVPEPEFYAMLLAGIGLLGIAARRRKV